ncbi:aminopeptidase [bacterium]|nr:aminopeptidase [candidate division CSSED10-310 bacterium]
MKELFWQDPRIMRWAEVIVDFCTEVKPGERVEITGEIDGEPLMLALYRRCLEAGAFPVIAPVFPTASGIFYRHAGPDQLSHVHKIDEFRVRHTDVSLHVTAEPNTKSLTWVDPAKLKMVRLARRKLGRIRKERIRWNVTSYPTHAYAQDAAMSIQEFADFIFHAGFLVYEDAVERWRNLRLRQQKMTHELAGTKVFRIETPECDLRLGTEGRIICESSGKVNMPDGEIYTGPVENAVDGWIKFSYPGCYLGQEAAGIRLEFRRGRVAKASAETNESFLMKMLDTDPGARRIGELGIGTNWEIKRFTRNLLFDEKMGGTIHLALGDSYAETLGKNRSAIHWDLLHDLRREGRIYADDAVLMENGRFAGRFEELWNETPVRTDSRSRKPV